MSLSRPRSLWRTDSSYQSQEAILLPTIDQQGLHDQTRPFQCPDRDPNSTFKDIPFVCPPTPNASTIQGSFRLLKQVLLDWYPEILFLTLSTATLLIATGILLTKNHTPLATWHAPISLNAVISALIVATKSSLIFVTAKCVSQLKWNHFADSPRSVYDLKTFDEASKGPLGAVGLAFKGKSVSFVAVLGAGVMVGSVFIETFGQQVLGFSSLEVRDLGAVARFPITQRLATQEGWYLDYTVMSGIQKLLLAAIFRGKVEPEFECGTGACSWGSSATLGFCSRCVDVTEVSVGQCVGESKQLECGYVTPSGVRMGGTVEVGGPMPLINTSTVDGVYDDTPSFYNFSTLVVAESTNWTARLTECEISWCAWVFKNATSQGTELSLSTAEQFPLNSTGTWEYTDAAQSLDDTQKVYTAIGAFPQGLNDTFTISEGKEYFLKYAVRLILKAGYQGADLYTQLTLATSSLDYTDTESLARNLAASMTNALRTQDGMQAIGTAWQSVVFIRIRWIWLLLPAMEVFTAGVLLCLTIVQSTRQQAVLWKSSLLAFVFCFAQGWTSDVNTETASPKSMERASREMEARLERDAEGRVRLVQV